MTLSPVQLQLIAADPQACSQLLSASPHLLQLVNEQVRRVYEQQVNDAIGYDTRNIEVDVDATTLDQLFSVVARQWHYVGAQAPHHSVLATEQWRPELLNDETLAKFYATGAEEVALLRTVCDRNGLSLNGLDRCLELGCGVARVTVHLASLFTQVQGLDVSPGNLAEAHKAIAQRNVRNIETTLLKNPSDIQMVPEFDLFFSRIVLQHNPPPVQHYLLDSLLAKLRPGGLAFFQVITSGPRYAYSAHQHLQHHATQDFEMHALPMRTVFEVLQARGCIPVEVFRDLAGGFNVGSYTFLARKLY